MTESQSSSLASAGKMAEVRQSLRGAHLLSTLWKIKSPPDVNGPNVSQLLVASCTLTGGRCCGIRKETYYTCIPVVEYRRLSKNKGEELYTRRNRLRNRLQENETRNDVLCFVSSVPGRPTTYSSSRLSGEKDNSAQTLKTQIYSSPTVQPYLHASLIAGRIACWSQNRFVHLSESFHAQDVLPCQPLREFRTFTFMLAKGNGLVFGFKCNQLKCQPDSIHLTITRFYSSNGKNSTKDRPLYRSRTSYYDILSISPNATHSQIKTAYYKQSFINHPDKNPGNELATQHFSEISEAYTVLGNISLRKKYDRGMLSQSDVQGAGRPSSRESRATTGSHFQQQSNRRPRHFSQAGGKAMFDFDAFYQAHYGEQLQRMRAMKARQEMFQQKQKEQFKKWKRGKILDLTVGMLLAMAVVVAINLHRP